MKPTTKADAPTAKLTPEQKQVLDIVNKSRYSAAQLEKLMWYCRLIEAEDFSDDLHIALGIILCSAEDIPKEEIGALAKIFGFARTLVDITRMK